MHTLAPMPNPGAAAPSRLHALLRNGTATAHRQLEDALAMLQPVPQPARFAALLSRLLGFHRVFDPALAARLGDGAFTRPRQRTAVLEADLAALGWTAAALAAVPPCRDAAALCHSTDSALGAIYVTEGSTLGGRVIQAHLAGQPWLPAGGLRSFTPHGQHTGSAWRATLATIEVRAADPQQVLAGARAAFALLQRWLPAR